MISVIIIGTGNVAQNFFEAFCKVSSITVTAVFGRSSAALAFFENRTQTLTDYSEIPQADVYLIAVKDDAILEVARKLPKQGFVAHTSGGLGMSELLPLKNRGVFYPLQTFTKNKILGFSSIPICVEATTKSGLKLLENLGEKISTKVVLINSEQRAKLHLAAVFANNFTNYLYSIGAQICEEASVDFELLAPLIKETACKIEAITPLEVQTGPAIRGDQKTMDTHLQLLENASQKELYKLVSKAIKETHHSKKN